MCGLVGIFSSEGLKGFKDRKSFFTQMLFVDTLRGPDSTGIMLVGNDVKTYKKAMSAPDFLDLGAVSKLFFSFEDYYFAVGHNRWATKGSVNSENAHPFQHGPITMVHNGTLVSWSSLTPHGVSFSTDSEHICHSLAHNGIKDTIKTLDGAFALIWYNSETECLNMIRNDERPLSFAIVEGSDTVLVGSEVLMLKWIASRNGMKIEEVVNCEPGRLYTFFKKEVADWKEEDLQLKPKSTITTYGYYPTVVGCLKSNDLKMGQRIEFILTDIEEYRIKKGTSDNCKITGYLPDNIAVNVACYSASYSQVKDLKGKRVSGEITGSWVTKNNEDFISVKDVSPLFVVGPKGSLVPLQDYTDLVSDGCENCGSHLSVSDADNITWINNSPVCVNCIEDLTIV